jgi:hypothetical protein
MRRVRCLGPLEASELAGWMHRAAIYALPARYEPFGLSALEAAQAGCALVLGDLSSLREVWGTRRGSCRRPMPGRWPGRSRRSSRTRGCGAGWRPWRPRACGAVLAGRMAAGYSDAYGRLAAVDRSPQAGVMRFVFVCHSVLSDWNHGNAHLLRGVVTELQARGHDVVVCEPPAAGAPRTWCRARRGRARGCGCAYPGLQVIRYDRRGLEVDRAIATGRRGDRARVECAGRSCGGLGRHPARRRLRPALPRHPPPRGERPGGHAQFDLRRYDGVLAFGDVLRERYLRRAGRAAPGPGTRPPTRVSSRRGPTSCQGRATSCGSATGATRSGPPSCRSSCSTRCAIWACGRVYGVRYPERGARSAGRGGHRVRRLAAELPGARGVRQAPGHGARAPAALRAALPGIPTIRPSRRWPAASRW